MDAKAAKLTTWLDDDNIIPYGDKYIHSSVRHPMEFVGDVLTQFGYGTKRIGLEMESYYFLRCAMRNCAIGSRMQRSWMRACWSIGCV